MRTRNRRLALLAGVFLLVGAASPAVASETSSSYTDGALRKLGRGIANVASCPAELIRTPELTGRKDGYVAALTTGLVQGAWRTLVRGVGGVFEIATFYAEIPKGFKPIVEPEFVWAHGDWAE